MIVLGIESSCDETAVAILDDKKILSHELLSQVELHTSWGGVVPELAARSHIDNIDTLINFALANAKIGLEQIDLFCATLGPGLAGSLLVGAIASQSLALLQRKPFLGVNHLHAHLLMPLMFYDEIVFPFLALLISGGHTQILLAHDLFHYDILGSTLDDSIGETFDKVARAMKLPYPGGVFIERYAKKGDMNKYSFPKPLYGSVGCNFSLSGLKTSVKNYIVKNETNLDYIKYDLSASFQKTICDIIIDRLTNAILLTNKLKIKQLIVSGGVAANLAIKNDIIALSKKYDIKAYFPNIEYCTDNAVMVSWAGLNSFYYGKVNDFDKKIDPKWSLTNLI